MNTKFFKIILIFLVFFTSKTAFALGPLDFGFSLGVSTPNDEINNIFNSENLDFLQDSTSKSGEILNEAVSLGYHLGVNLRVNLPKNISLIGGFAYHKFPESKIEVNDPIADTLLFSVNSSQNIIPINVGILYDVINTKFFDIYIRGEGQLNFISYSQDFNLPIGSQSLSLPIPVNETERVTRIGVGFGGGFDIDLTLLILNLDVRYNITNLALKDENENSKNYLSVGFGVYF